MSFKHKILEEEVVLAMNVGNSAVKFKTWLRRCLEVTYSLICHSLIIKKRAVKVKWAWKD